MRHRAEQAAEAYGASLAIEQVRPTWSGVSLKGVDVRLRGAPSISIRLEEVDVALGFSGRRVAMRGGTVSAVGPREAVLHELETWRAGQPAGRPSTASTGGGGSTELEGLRLVWSDRADAPSERLSADGVRLARAEGRTAISAREAMLSLGRAALSVREGRLVLVREQARYQVSELSAAAIDAEVALPEVEREAPAAPERGGITQPAQVQRAAQNVAGQEGGQNRGAAIRDALLRTARAIDLALGEGAKVDVAGVTARLKRDADMLNLGPGSLAVRRESGSLVVELSPGEAAIGAVGTDAQQALTFRLRVPLSDAKEIPQEIVADVQGGPIWLSTLGVREGDMGLFDVARTSIVSRARVVLSADGQTLGIDGEGRLKNLSLRSPALADEPVAGLDLAWRAKADGKLDGSKITAEDAEVDLGALRLIARGEYERAGASHRVRGSFEVPLTACQSMLDSAPRGVVGKLQGMRLAGSFGIEGKLRFDTASLDRTFSLDWGISNTCRVTEMPPELSVDRFKRAFRRLVYGPGGQRVETESGPGTPEWVPYEDISRFMEVAVLTTEDGGFHRHHGFDEQAIKNSIRENLRKRRFVRGASTVSMQLAKNLYLERTKSVARKLQETLFTMYLEQELTKEQIMELYLNVVEFGPLVYGIGAAARHYFNASAAQLSLGQALYIASILPNPKVQHFGPSGEVTPAWSGYLRKLMQIAHRRHRISDEELEKGLQETVVRGSPAPHLAPRQPPGEGDEERPGPDEAQDDVWTAP
ncbi:peptidoglycan transglycosylase [Sorangium cellulosum]|uniref:Peptidoglycan transglycosylase n=1 Tax=Sorangium cellulosum TaxID=56 RepID=A0A150PH47_SORCE|nr:peptidoglycan transglycosylase [Sorangium cellulosum]